MTRPDVDYLDHFRKRVLLDAFNEASADYWHRRAGDFERVGTPACDEIARACRNRAAFGDAGADARTLIAAMLAEVAA